MSEYTPPENRAILEPPEDYHLLAAEEEVALAQEIEAGLYAEKILGLIDPDSEVRDATAQAIYDGAFYSNLHHRKKLENLTPEEEYSYHQMAWQHLETIRRSATKYSLTDVKLLKMAVSEGGKAKERFIKSNIGLAKMVVRRYFSRTSPDLDQEAFAGLIRAIDRFDFTLGCKFSGTGFRWIYKYVREAADTDHLVRLPTNLMYLRAKAPDLDLSSAAEITEVATELNRETSTLHAISRAQHIGSLSVDFLADAANGTIADQANPETDYIQRERDQSIRDILTSHRNRLSERDQQIVDLYLTNMSCQKISTSFQLTRQRIEQIILGFKTSLREVLLEAGLVPNTTRLSQK